MFDLKGKRALITGSTQGIGLEIAKCLLAFGAEVFINGSNPEKAERALKSVPGATLALCDLSRPDAAEILHGVTGEIDILVSNASVQYRTPWDKIEDAELERQIDINFKAALRLIQKYAPGMCERGFGRIITVGSVQQEVPHKDMLIYAAMKSAQENMVRNLAKQLAPHGVTVNNVAPGVIETPRNTEALADKEYAKRVIEGIPVGYAGAPEDVSGLVLLLSSKEGRYITGENIYVDGGMKL